MIKLNDNWNTALGGQKILLMSKTELRQKAEPAFDIKEDLMFQIKINLSETGEARLSYGIESIRDADYEKLLIWKE